MTCIVHPDLYTSKGRLQQLCDTVPEELVIVDPSIVRPRTFTAADIKEGEVVYVTNHPKRTKFAKISRVGGILGVE